MPIIADFGCLGPMVLLCLFVVACAIGGVVGIAVVGLWVWTLIDCVRNEPDTGNTRVLWLVIVLLTFVVGAALYLVIRRPVRLVKCGR